MHVCAHRPRSVSAPDQRAYVTATPERGRQLFHAMSQSPMPQMGAYPAASPIPSQGQCGLGVTLRNDRNGDLRVVDIVSAVCLALAVHGRAYAKRESVPGLSLHVQGCETYSADIYMYRT
jgi:hypothetical protein